MQNFREKNCKFQEWKSGSLRRSNCDIRGKNLSGRKYSKLSIKKKKRISLIFLIQYIVIGQMIFILLIKKKKWIKQFWKDKHSNIFQESTKQRINGLFFINSSKNFSNRLWSS